MPTQVESTLFSLLNQLEEADRKRSKAISDLARALSDMARKDAWERIDVASTEARLLQEKVLVAWSAVKDGVVAKAVGDRG